MLRICLDCTAAYSVGAPLCPQCGSERAVDEDTDPYRGGDELMPKITKHGGPSYAADLPSEDEESGGEQSSPGTSSQTSHEKPASASKTSSGGGSKRARTTERRTARDRTDSSTAPSTGTARTERTSPTDAADTSN